MSDKVVIKVKRIAEALDVLNGVVCGLRMLGPGAETYVANVEAVIDYLEVIDREYTVGVEVKGRQLGMFDDTCADLPLFSGSVVRK